MGVQDFCLQKKAVFFCAQTQRAIHFLRQRSKKQSKNKLQQQADKKVSNHRQSKKWVFYSVKYAGFGKKNKDRLTNRHLHLILEVTKCYNNFSVLCFLVWDWVLFFCQFNWVLRQRKRYSHTEYVGFQHCILCSGGFLLQTGMLSWNTPAPSRHTQLHL